MRHGFRKYIWFVFTQLAILASSRGLDKKLAGSKKTAFSHCFSLNHRKLGADEFHSRVFRVPIPL
jgi:hypothetical protein